MTRCDAGCGYVLPTVCQPQPLRQFQCLAAERHRELAQQNLRAATPLLRSRHQPLRRQQFERSF